MTPSVAPSSNAHPIDLLMERASVSLVSTNYFETETLCLRALAAARKLNDFERMARICLPLQEARRQRRQMACDYPGCHIVTQLPSRGDAIAPGRYLLAPPLVGKDGRLFRELCERQFVIVIVLVREPANRAGKWPIVGVGTGPREAFVTRTYAAPPADEASPALDWYLAAHEALGDAAILKVPSDGPVSIPADHHVDDLLDALEAVPDHEKLIQAVAAACRGAVNAPLSSLPRRRPLASDDLSF